MFRCSWCGIKYEKSRNVKYKHRDHCSFSCKENAIDADAQVNGLFMPATGEDTPSRMFDWVWSESRLY